MITIFTPVFNRANIIYKLYESIKRQTFRDFEWLVINDGSVDNIDDVMNAFINEGILNIRYYAQENGGKHRAINKGIELAKGELFFIVDSDDTITSDALYLLNKYYQQIKEDTRFAGVSGYRCLPNGCDLYSKPSNSVLDCSSLEFICKYNRRGGMAEAYKLSVLKQYPFPDIPGEKFCAESLVWNRIAKEHILRYFNKQIYVWNYLPDGLTRNSIKNRRQSSTYAMMNYSEALRMNMNMKWKVRNAINYWRFYFVNSRKLVPQMFFLWYLFAPIGYILCKKDEMLV